MKHPYRILWYRFSAWGRRFLNVIWLVVAAGYLAVLAGQAIYRNYQTQQETARLKDQLQQKDLEEQRLQALLVYYRTDSFKEKELRRTMLLQKPGEKVYALPESNVARKAEDEALQQAKAPVSHEASLPIWRQWLEYIFANQKG